MPFTCPIHFDAQGLGVAPPAGATLSRWLPVKRGQVLAPNTAIAVVTIAGRTHQLRTTFPCMLGRQMAQEGAVLVEGTPLAEVYGEGEDLPYGGSYCVLDPAFGPAR